METSRTPSSPLAPSELYRKEAFEKEKRPSHTEEAELRDGLSIKDLSEEKQYTPSGKKN